MQPPTKPDIAAVLPPLPEGPGSPKDVVLACVDRSRQGRRVLAHAGALAKAMGGRIVLLRVLATNSGNEMPPDPLDWEVRRREAGASLERLAERVNVEVEVSLTQGHPASEICHVADRYDAKVIVFGSRGEGVEYGERPAGLGATARSVLECAQDKVLLVPDGGQRDPSFRRLLVPLDGSCWAECALPTAARLARSLGAEIVLAHIVTRPEFLGSSPPEPEDGELHERIAGRNRRFANAYLERQRAVLAEQGIAVRTRVMPAADARSALLRLMEKAFFDLVVLSARGTGYRHLPGLHLGSVAAHLSLHSTTPLLIVRPDIHGALLRGGRAPTATVRSSVAMHA